MQRNLKALLFSPQGEERPLFASQADLARQIAANPKSKYFGKSQSLGVFLGQIMLGRRACPAELQESLLGVVRAECAARGLEPARSDDLAKRLHALLVAASSTTESVDELLSRQLEASDVVVVNPATLEQRGHPRGVEFQRAMLDALVNGGGSYTFVFDESREQAETDFWRDTALALEAFIESDEGEPNSARDEADRLIHELRDTQRLVTVCVPSGACVVPMVAFNPRRRAYCSLFVWDWWIGDDGSVVDRIAMLSAVTTAKWLDDFYLVAQSAALGAPRSLEALVARR